MMNWNRERCLLAAAFVAAVVCAGPIAPDTLCLKGGARLEKGVLVLDGKDSYASIPGTESLGFQGDGFTLACAVRLKIRTLERKGPDGYDMLFSKGKSDFIFGRYGGQLYWNVTGADGKMNSAQYSSTLPEAETWAHLAITFERYDNAAQGDVGFLSAVYLNGNRIGGGKLPWLAPRQNQALMEIGRGWGGVWFLEGEIAEIFVEPRALNEAEIADLADASRLARPQTAHRHNPQLDSVKAVSPFGKWLLRTLHAAPVAAGSAIAAELGASFARGEDEVIIRALQKGAHGLRLHVGREMLVLVSLKDEGGTPVLGIYDRVARRTVVEDTVFTWELKGMRGGRRELRRSADFPFAVSNWRDGGFEVEWRVGETRVKSGFLLSDGGISSDLRVENNNPDFLVEQVVFPSLRLANAGEGDALFYPYQCGVVIPNPSRNSFKYGQKGYYPSQSMTMQFAAYYGQGRGVYLGWEDNHGTAKEFNAYGKRGGVNIDWSQAARHTLQESGGGNSYNSPGRFAMRLYDGKWFEACRLHRMAMAEADWAVGTLPRRDTPSWFLDAPVAIEATAISREASMERLAEIALLRKYFDVPLYCTLYAWDDPKKGGWPQFSPRDFIPEYIASLRKSGCEVEPYSDALLWQVHDAPDGKGDFRYRDFGEKYAVRLADGSVPLERYRAGDFAKMCPAVVGWRQELLSLFDRMDRMGGSAIYHDQVATTRPQLCFSASHGHALNDPDAWYRQGYRVLYQAVRRRFPDVPHTTEEISEPYVSLFDGAHIWRWTFDGQVPGFQAVYGGAVQYMCLVYNAHGKGEYDSNFVKMAYSLVTGLKLGKFQTGELYHADLKRLFAKKMVHLRLCLTPYFNGGEMLPPVEYDRPVQMKTTGWSTSGKENEAVTMPVVLAGGYRLGKSRMWVFVNSTGEAQEVFPLDLKGWLCLEGAHAVASFAGQIVLPPYASAVVLDGSQEEAGRIQRTLDRIATFTPGESFDCLVRFDSLRTIRPTKGQWVTPSDASGFHNLSKAVTGAYFGNTAEGSLISYGNVDFGAAEVKRLQVRVAVPEQYAGGAVELLAGKSLADAVVVGKIVVPATSGWTDFREVDFPLDSVLTGEVFLMFRFNRNGCCNFADWRY
ncbi:MAG: carbohydrate-binding protein [Victivallales bacterium]|nr:carbohydrate-binding protein [Victivallales bacterium]